MVPLCVMSTTMTLKRPIESDRGVDSDCPCDQDTSSFGIKGVNSRVDIDRVITWLTPIGEA